DNKIKAIKIPPKVHVLLSKKSVVFCTPPICCVPPPKEDDNPPPLGFCTMIAKINKKQTIVIAMKNPVNIFLLLFFCYFFIFLIRCANNLLFSCYFKINVAYA